METHNSDRRFSTCTNPTGPNLEGVQIRCIGSHSRVWMFKSRTAVADLAHTTRIQLTFMDVGGSSTRLQACKTAAHHDPSLSPGPQALEPYTTVVTLSILLGLPSLRARVRPRCWCEHEGMTAVGMCTARPIHGNVLLLVQQHSVSTWYA